MIPVLCAASLQASSVITLHSHNDYLQRVPFYQAYAQNITIIEADIFIDEKEKKLLVAHGRDDLNEAMTLDELYLKPIAGIYKRNKGKIRKDSEEQMILMIDLKTSYEKTLPLLITKLKSYKGVFDNPDNLNTVKVVISGSMPPPDDFDKYPEFIFFDGRLGVDYNSDQLKRIYMISDSFNKYSKWNGKGIPVKAEKTRLDSVINTVHNTGKPVRFWGTPDGITAWNTLYEMGVDVIGTKKPELCAAFFKDYHNKVFALGEINHRKGVSGYNRLDKATSGFTGFNSENMSLEKKTEVYTPTYEHDAVKKKVKNVILMIGDGMGLSQIGAANTVNGDLSMLKIKHVGLMHTHAEDAFTTDSAGAGSTMASGRKNKNRHISADENGNPYETITGLFHKEGKVNGIVTLGNIADATPAAFYAHTNERDNTDEIVQYIDKGIITLLCGSGKELLNKQSLFNYTLTDSVEQIAALNKKIICLDERMAAATTSETLPLLSQSLTYAVNHLEKESDKGFFLMVEGAKIDYAGHANSVPATIMEMLSFDMAVAEALKYADSNGETLVIVTGDHETGGMVLIDGCNNSNRITASFITDDHTPLMLPVFSYGPYSDEFTGVYSNSDISIKILNLLSK